MNNKFYTKTVMLKYLSSDFEIVDSKSKPKHRYCNSLSSCESNSHKKFAKNQDNRITNSFRRLSVDLSDTHLGSNKRNKLEPPFQNKKVKVFKLNKKRNISQRSIKRVKSIKKIESKEKGIYKNTASTEFKLCSDNIPSTANTTAKNVDSKSRGSNTSAFFMETKASTFSCTQNEDRPSTSQSYDKEYMSITPAQFANV